MTARRLPCWACFKVVARMPRRGKRTHPHLCPHGVRCIAGTPLGAEGWNGPPLGGPHYCKPCVDEHRAYWRARENGASIPGEQA